MKSKHKSFVHSHRVTRTRSRKWMPLWIIHFTTSKYTKSQLKDSYCKFKNKTEIYKRRNDFLISKQCHKRIQYRISTVWKLVCNQKGRLFQRCFFLFLHSVPLARYLITLSSYMVILHSFITFIYRCLCCDIYGYDYHIR